MVLPSALFTRLAFPPRCSVQIGPLSALTSMHESTKHFRRHARFIGTEDAGSTLVALRKMWICKLAFAQSQSKRARIRIPRKKILK
jgi:hypothetical protein